jgi:hypothetical protein
MADLKISALTGATTPLAGSEVLPIVQSSTTKKVSIANITAGRDVSMKQLTATADSFIGTDNGGFKYYFGTFTNAAGGANNAYFSAGLADLNEKAGFMWQTRDAIGDLNNVFKLDGDQNATLMAGNLVIGTSGKGIDFSATSHPAGMTSELLSDYEEGTWTPGVLYSGTNTPTIATQLGRYTKVGRLVTVQAYVSWNENGSTGNVDITGLPFTSLDSSARAIASVFSFGLTGLPTNMSITAWVLNNSTRLNLYLNDNAATRVTNTYTSSDQDLFLTVTYEAA